MNINKNKIWNGLLHGNYSYIVCQLSNNPEENQYQKWISIHDIKKEKQELDSEELEWIKKINEKEYPYLSNSDGKKYVVLEFESTKIDENYVEEQNPQILNKTEKKVLDLETLLNYLKNRNINWEEFEPPHLSSYPLNHTTWGEH